MSAPIITISSQSPEDTREFGRRLGAFLQPGDVVLLDGELGAGKTTLVQGLGEQLGVRGRVTSPTYIVARVHPASDRSCPALVHVDAYRLEDDLDMETVDLGSSLEDAITVIEWGSGKAEDLSDERFEIRIDLGLDDETRVITVAAHGEGAQARLAQQSQVLSLGGTLGHRTEEAEE